MGDDPRIAPPGGVTLSSASFYGWPFMPPGAHAIQPAGKTQPGQGQILAGGQPSAGKLFDATLTGAVIRRDGSHGRAWYGTPMGLAFNIETETVSGAPSAESASIRLRFGDGYGGAETERTFSLTSAGVWIVAAGWAFVKADVVGLPLGNTTGVINYEWTTRSPRPPSRLLFIETIAATPAAGRVVPAGAVEVAVSLVDAGWSYLTDTGAGDVTIAQPQPGGGVTQRILGARYFTAVPNSVCWFLEAP